jgi:uncharacterized protein DUF742
MITPRDSWLDQEAGPVVRPYAMTKGRTMPSDGTPLGMIDIVQATGRPSDGFRFGPEHRQILDMCRAPVAAVDLASDLDLPFGVVRVLISDLSGHGLLQIVPAARRGPVADARLLRDVLDGLRAL